MFQILVISGKIYSYIIKGGTRMNNHLYYSSTTLNENRQVQLGTLNNLLKLESEDNTIGIQIKDNFPISKFGKDTEMILLNGVEELMEAYEKIDAKKIDIVQKLENVNYEGYIDDNKIILSFEMTSKEDRLTATGIYDFTKDFLDSNFQLYNYAKYCMENGFRDVVRENVEEMFNKHENKSKQYRLIEKNENWHIRAMTSKYYRNYDNNIILYLTILHLHKYASKEGESFSLEKAEFSDSELRIFFQKTKPIKVQGLGDIYVGLFVSNSEIKDKAFTFELRYKVVDENKDTQFGVLPKISDALINVTHRAKLETLVANMSQFQQLDKKHEETVQLIKDIKKINKLNPNQIYKLFEKIISNKELNKGTKNNFKEYYDNNLVNKTIGIIELLSKSSDLAEELDQRVVLERIYYNLIIELLKS